MHHTLFSLLSAKARHYEAMRLVTLLALAVCCLASACTHVAPYERARLAHPTMTSDLGGVAAEHVHAVHEGAAGGGSVAESGCGCN